MRDVHCSTQEIAVKIIDLDQRYWFLVELLFAAALAEQFQLSISKFGCLHIAVVARRTTVVKYPRFESHSEALDLVI